MHQHFFMAAVPDDPEELARQAERTSAEYTSNFLKLHGFLTGLDSDQLAMLELIIFSIMSDHRHGVHMIGLIGGYQRFVHHKCECGSEPAHPPEAHDDASFIILQGQKADPEQQDTSDFPEREPDMTWSERQAKLEQYNLVDDPQTEGALNPERVRCRGCDIHYVSLEDRMLQPPGVEGCSGCQIVAGHGGGNPW